jgi:hypothetical protein
MILLCVIKNWPGYKGIKVLGEGRNNPPPPYVSNQIFEIIIGSGVSTLELFYFIDYYNLRLLWVWLLTSVPVIVMKVKEDC